MDQVTLDQTGSQKEKFERKTLGTVSFGLFFFRRKCTECHVSPEKKEPELARSLCSCEKCLIVSPYSPKISHF